MVAVKKVFVTGAEGFIGSHLVELLVRSGYSVKALALYNSFDHRGWLDDLDEEVLGQVELVVGDVRDSGFVRNAIKGSDAVLHLAALIGIPYSYTSPESYLDTNIRGTLNVLQAARDEGVDLVVHTSTSEVYGSAQYVPIDESHPLVGQSPYSASKISADQLAWSFWSSFELPMTILRPFNTYGPRQSTRAVIPTIITQLASGMTEINLGDTSTTRDFSFVHDTARGFLHSLTNPSGIGEVINLGSGFEVAIDDVVRTVSDLMNVSATVVTQGKRVRPENSEVRRLFADNSKAKKLLGWEPEFGGLEGFKKGLEQTISWYSGPQNLAKFRLGDYTL